MFKLLSLPKITDTRTRTYIRTHTKNSKRMTNNKSNLHIKEKQSVSHKSQVQIFRIKTVEAKAGGRNCVIGTNIHRHKSTTTSFWYCSRTRKWYTHAYKPDNILV